MFLTYILPILGALLVILFAHFIVKKQNELTHKRKNIEDINNETHEVLQQEVKNIVGDIYNTENLTVDYIEHRLGLFTESLKSVEVKIKEGPKRLQSDKAKRYRSIPKAKPFTEHKPRSNVPTRPWKT